MLKKIIFIVLVVVFCILLFLLLQFSNYLFLTLNQSKTIAYCSDNYDKKCMGRMFTLILPKLLINNAKINGENLKFIILDWKPRLSPVISIDKAEALISYGSYDETQFENNYALNFNKQPVYVFDCGVDKISTMRSNVHFYSECIGTDRYILKNQESSKKIHKFGDKLKELGLENKKIFLKMDIAGAEMEVIPDILKYADQITAINLALHLENPQYIIGESKILEDLKKNFILVARNTLQYNETIRDMHSPYYTGYLDDYALELAFINKNLVDDYKISFIQNTDKLFILNKNYIYGKNVIKNKIPTNNISYVITIVEIIKEKINRVWKKHF